MLEVQKFLKENGLSNLKNALAIKVKEYNLGGTDVVVLNYNQIGSPKMHPIVRECRSLMLEKGTWNVVSRAFDRFFNLGEAMTDVTDWSKVYCMDKLDGSLLPVFNFKGQWGFRTKGTMGEAETMTGNTFDELALKAFNCADMDAFNDFINYFNIPHNITLLFELCTPENIMVTHHTEYKVRLLGGRHIDGQYVQVDIIRQVAIRMSDLLGYEVNVAVHRFGDTESVTNFQSMSFQEEGYVVYNEKFEPICKIKNPAYVNAHHMLGEGTPSPKNICNLVIANEQAEFLAYFPQLQPIIAPYIAAHKELQCKLLSGEASFRSQVDCFKIDRKETAIMIKATFKAPFQNILMGAIMNNKPAMEVFTGYTAKQRTMILSEIAEKYKV